MTDTDAINGACCTNGDCCGPGSYCCAHTGPHTHLELEENCE